MNILGVYQDKPVYYKRGRFGEYVIWDNMNYSINKNNGHDLFEFAINVISHKKSFLNSVSTTSQFGPRKLSALLKLCKRRDGTPYVIYTPPEQVDCIRLGFRGFTYGDPLKCSNQILIDWLCHTYNIETREEQTVN